MPTNRYMTILILIVLYACSPSDTTVTSSPNEQTPTSTYSHTPSPQSTSSLTPTPAYYLNGAEISIVIHAKPADLPPGDYLLYELVHIGDLKDQYQFAYTSFDGRVNGPLFDIISPEGILYSLISYFPNGEDLKRDIRFIYSRSEQIDDRWTETERGFLFIDLDSGIVRQMSSSCVNGWYSVPDLITPYALFVCNDTLYLVSLETWEVEQITFSRPYPGRGFLIEWISPDLVWFGSDAWRYLDIDYAYCTLRISSRYFQCHRDLPSYAYKIYPLSKAGPAERFLAYYESLDGDVHDMALFYTEYLEDPHMAINRSRNLPFGGQWVPDSNILFSISDEYPYQSVATYRRYDIDQQSITELGSIPETMIPHMVTTDRMGFWSPDGLHYILKFEFLIGDEFVEEVWQISVVTGEMEQLAPGIHNIRDVIGYFQVP